MRLEVSDSLVFVWGVCMCYNNNINTNNNSIVVH